MKEQFTVGSQVTFFGEPGQVVEGPDEQGFLFINWDKEDQFDRKGQADSRIHQAEWGLHLAGNEPKMPYTA